MIHVIDFLGVYLPTLLLLAVLSVLLLWLVSRALAATGFYRLVWHRPLFDLALYLSILALSDLAFRWAIS